MVLPAVNAYSSASLPSPARRTSASGAAGCCSWRRSLSVPGLSRPSWRATKPLLPASQGTGATQQDPTSQNDSACVQQEGQCSQQRAEKLPSVPLNGPTGSHTCSTSCAPPVKHQAPLAQAPLAPGPSDPSTSDPSPGWPAPTPAAPHAAPCPAPGPAGRPPHLQHLLQTPLVLIVSEQPHAFVVGLQGHVAARGDPVVLADACSRDSQLRWCSGALHAG